MHENHCQAGQRIHPSEISDITYNFHCVYNSICLLRCHGFDSITLPNISAVSASMPPFHQFGHRFEGRQNEASPAAVVLSITRQSTTYTTTLDLTHSTAPASNPTSTSPISQEPAIQATSPDTPNTGVIVGAILGSILGTFVLLTLLYKCCIGNRSALYSGGGYSYESESDSGRSSQSSRVRNRGGGYEQRRRHHHHSSVRSPRRARTRQHRHTRERSESPQFSLGSGSRRRRRSTMTKKNGMFGWKLAPRMKYYESHERRWPSERRGKDFTVDD
jgi:hypothetical protein